MPIAALSTFRHVNVGCARCGVQERKQDLLSSFYSSVCGRGTPAVRSREFMNDHDVYWRKLLVYGKRNSGNELDTATLNLGSLIIPTYYKSNKDFSVWSSCIWEGPLSFRQFSIFGATVL